MPESFKMELLDPDKLVKVNNLQEVTNPIFFIKDNVPTSDGLLSNEIFGISKEDRANTFAYIDLHDTFMHPLCYKIWLRMDKRIRDIVHGTKTYIINAKGDFEESEDGKNGIKFLKDNFDLIKIKSTESTKRDKNIQFLKDNKDKMFITKMIVIPAYYRDVNTGDRYVGVGAINKLYTSLLVAVKSLKEASDYGLSMSAASKGRIQEILLDIYTRFTTGDENDGPGLSSKQGVIRRSNMNKTTDYASRLVLSAPNLKVESVEDLDVNLEYTAVPLSSICSNFFPQMIFNVRRFFENEFAGKPTYDYVDSKGELKQVKVKDYQIEFSDTVIKKQMERFMLGYSNRFIPIKVPNYEGKSINMVFKGYNMTAEDYAKNDPGNMPIIERDLTWCDVFYMAAVESVKDKTILITRYPINN